MLAKAQHSQFVRSLPLLLVAAVLVLATFGSPLLARQGNACGLTAQAAFRARNAEAWADFWIAVGNCRNLGGAGRCLREARGQLREDLALARQQRQARLEVCAEVGSGPYAPEIDPEDFVDFEEVLEGDGFTPNPYFPLIPGSRWEYLAVDDEGEPFERVLVEVLEETTEILGVNCIVVRDRVWEIEDEEEVLIEDTADWYAQHVLGEVWYFGELSQEFEDGLLVSLEGSWRAGVDEAQPGIIMLADPQPDDFYRQEFALGDAEDVARVVSRGAESVSVPFGDFDSNVLQTRDFTPIEPGVFELKHYVLGIGPVLEIDPESGERLELIDVNIP